MAVREREVRECFKPEKIKNRNSEKEKDFSRKRLFNEN
jgi:hypothetical protein